MSMALSSLNPMSMFTAPTSLSTPQVAAAKIETVDADESIELECQFNPAQLKIKKRAKWEVEKGIKKERNAPIPKFSGGEAATFDLDLVFDTTQESSSSDRDVRNYTNQLLKLTMLQGSGDDRKDPPRVKFQWGDFTLFTAVVTSVSIAFTLFDAGGTPVRAKASVDFLQYDTADDAQGAQNPTTRTEARRTHLVRQGERLDLIAYAEYGHPSHWRHLAEANGLLDPLDLRPGQILAVPPLP